MKRHPKSLPGLALLVSLHLAGAGCGARSSLVAPELDTEELDGSAGDAGERSCLPSCTVGHQCCVGSCDGPPVPLPSDCCPCLPGEVNSMNCGGECGGDP